jgi:hypothetical protein
LQKKEERLSTSRSPPESSEAQLAHLERMKRLLVPTDTSVKSEKKDKKKKKKKDSNGESD